MNVTDKIILVTGSSSGEEGRIGEALCARFCAGGADFHEIWTVK